MEAPVKDLTQEEKKAIFDDMKQDLGFDITPANVDLEDRSRFTKMEISRAQQMHISALVQQVPAVMAAGMATQAYYVKFPEGLPHVLTKLEQGGFGGIIRQNGKIVGAASFFPLALQGAILGAFTAMSIVSGQYFLAQINSQLGMLQKGLDDVLQFLYGDKKAELISEMKFAQYAYENYSSIMESEVQRVATISSLQEGKKVAMKDIEFYIEDLNRRVNRKVKDKKGWITVKEETFKTKDCLELSIQLYVMTTVLEVYYSLNQEQRYLDYLKKDVSTYISRCNKRILADIGTLKGGVAVSPAWWWIEQADKDKMVKEIEKELEQLHQDEESERLKSLCSILDIAEQSTEYYISSDGDVYTKAS